MAEASEIYDRLIRLLTRREHGVQEMRTKLRQRFDDSESAIDEAIQQALDGGWLNDPRFVSEYLRAAVNRGHGPIKIQHALQQKGIDNDLVNAALSEADIDWSVVLQSVLDRKYEGAWMADFDKRQKQMRFMASRGFPMALIARQAVAGIQYNEATDKVEE